MTLDELAYKFGANSQDRAGNGYIVKCPAHDDNKPSLHLSEGKKTLVLFCHAGCETKDVVSAAGLTFADLKNGNGHKPQLLIEHIYDYKDESGNLVYQVLRKAGKKFTQRRPSESGEWVYNLNGVTRTPYRLPELLNSDADDFVFIPEGEKDVDNLRAIGLIATCNSGGAGKWSDNYAHWFDSRIAIILPDNDKPGEDHAAQVSSSLSRFAKGVTIGLLRLPDLPVKGDVSDWLKSGGNAEQLRKLAEGCLQSKSGEPPAPPPAKKAEREKPGDDLRLSDYENAERFVYQHGDDVRYCETWKKWLIWQQTHWREDDTQAVVRLAKETVRRIYAEAAEIEDSAPRKALVNHAKKSEAKGRITAMIGLAESEPGIPVIADQLDSDEWLLPCPNGTINLRTGEMHEASRDHYLTKLCPTNFHPDATAPKWQAFLERIFQGQGRLIKFVQRVAGYSITGDVSERSLFIFHGVGRNGKSTLLETISRVIGDRYATTTTADLLLSKPTVGDLTTAAYMASLKGYRMVSCSETEDGKRLAESAVKSMTGNEKISAMHKYSDPFSYKPQFKVWLATNHKPEIRGTDEAIWDRIKLIPFFVRIPDHEVNRHLIRDLLAEAEGILAWIVRGCLDWQQNGLSVPSDVKEATSSYRGEMDVFQAFIDERLLTGEEYTCKAGTLYLEYKKWCESTGEFCQKQRWFGQRLADRGFESRKGTAGVRYWDGLTVRNDHDDSGATSQ